MHAGGSGTCTDLMADAKVDSTACFQVISQLSIPDICKMSQYSSPRVCKPTPVVKPWYSSSAISLISLHKISWPCMLDLLSCAGAMMPPRLLLYQRKSTDAGILCGCCLSAAVVAVHYNSFPFQKAVERRGTLSRGVHGGAQVGSEQRPSKRQ